MQQAIQRKELDDLKQNIQILRDKETDYEQRIIAAENGVKEAESALEAALAEHRAAIKACQKLDEHKEIWAQEVAKEIEYNQEKEMEDFRTKDLDEFGSDDEVSYA